MIRSIQRFFCGLVGVETTLFRPSQSQLLTMMRRMTPKAPNPYAAKPPRPHAGKRK